MKQRINSGNQIAWTTLWILLLASLSNPANAAILLINNGSAPPDPANDLNPVDPTDFYYVRNVDCPPDWPTSLVNDPCPAPGAPTQVAFGPGTNIAGVRSFDTSTITLNGGAYQFVSSLNSSTVILNDGTFTGVALTAFETSTLEVRGGAPPSLTADGQTTGSPIVEIYGHGFELDGTPVGFGPVASGLLTGTLESGQPISATVTSIGNGTVILIQSPPPVPALSNWGISAIFAVLITLSIHAVRRSPTDTSA